MNTSPRQQFPGSTEPAWHPITLTAGSNIAFAGKANYQVKCYAVLLTAATSVNITFQDGATAFTGAMPMTSLAFDFEQKPFICSTGNDFVITSSGNAAGSIFVAVN